MTSTKELHELRGQKFAKRGALHTAMDTMHSGKAPPSARDFQERKAGEELEAALAKLPQERQAMLLNELFHGALKSSNPDIGDDAMLTLMAGLRPDQQTRIAQAYRGTGHMPREALAMIEERAKELGVTKNFIENNQIVMDEIEAMMVEPKMQRLQESGFHKVIEAITNGKLVRSGYEPDAMLSAAAWMKNTASGVFLINHNWYSVFEHAKNFDGGTVSLPYPLSVFEFRISGRRTICCLSTNVDEVDGILLIFTEFSIGWSMIGAYGCPDGDFFGVDIDPLDKAAMGTPVHRLMNILRKQIRAALIALSAQVAVTEVIRAPYRLNAKREKSGKVPLFDFHQINLAERKRYAPRLPEEGDIENCHARKRLHFVREHQRVLTNHSIKVRWHVRGDPDLGFVDKEYRL